MEAQWHNWNLWDEAWPHGGASNAFDTGDIGIQTSLYVYTCHGNLGFTLVGARDVVEKRHEPLISSLAV